ncbi:MAG: TonB-dependent receptor, partial [Verrucomicrobiae bacterium]|nr:TonB-dependent receptor [Verrucomicrobiae bacterium]
YGSRAMGGVINIRTRKPSQQPIAFAASAGYHTATDGHRESMVASGTQGDWSYLFAGSNTEDQDRRIPGGTLSDTSHESSNFLGRVGWNRENHTFQLLYDTYKLSSEANTRDDLVDGFVISKFRLDLPRRDRERIGLLYEGVDLGPQLDRLKIDAFRQFNDRTIVQEIAGVVLPMTTPPSFYDYLNEDKDTIDTRGVNLQTDWDFLPGHTTIAGFNYLEDQLDKILERTGSLRKGPLQTPVKAELDTDAFIRTEAVYLNNQWELNPQWQLNAGIRHYRVRSGLEASNDPNLTVGGNRDSHTIGSASLVYAPDDSSAFRFAWSEGYVYPTLLHLHTGSLFGQGNLTRPNPFLKPETSTNYEIGYRLQRGAVTLDLALFGTESQNYIASVRASTVPELGWAPTENTYTNLDTASARGVEIDFEYRPENSDLSGYLRGTWLRRRQNYASFSTYDNGQPEMVGKVGLRYFRKVRELVFIHLDGNLAAGSEAELESTRSTRATSSWHTVNLSLGITFTGK